MKIREAIIVEGIYDKITLDSVCDALVVPTCGFSIFTDEKRLSYIRSLAEKNGIIILMDSDSAGFKIRSFLSERIKTGEVRHAYIPARPGKEKRKNRPSAEGTLGVEGQDTETLLKVIRSVATQKEETNRSVTKLDFYTDGLSGSADSAARRALLSAHLSLPPHLSPKALLAAVNSLMTYDAYAEWIRTLDK
ncbi:MAG: DUF4093 domain-containing protein [Clostridia bacterium]|nr:DUF4093 domain-containing protein [Clostridia bacterium]